MHDGRQHKLLEEAHGGGKVNFAVPHKAEDIGFFAKQGIDSRAANPNAVLGLGDGKPYFTSSTTSTTVLISGSFMIQM